MRSAIQLPSLTNHILDLELQKAEKIIDDFIYSCSHGLRTPLKSMAGLVLLLKKCSQANMDDRQLYLRFFQDSIERIQNILTQFEEFAENSKDELKTERIHIRSFVDEILDGFKDQLMQLDISVSIHINQKGGFYTDTPRLRVVLLHIISNAIIFHDSSKEKKRIDFFVTASYAGCSIQVRDNGIGIEEPETDKLFDLFYRGSEKSNGTGIGLFIVKEVVAKMDGNISIHSKVNEGSTFSLWIPNQRPLLQGE